MAAAVTGACTVQRDRRAVAVVTETAFGPPGLLCPDMAQVAGRFECVFGRHRRGVYDDIVTT
ncbi:hypothetical protein D3C81_2283880 [compost metagenome]